MYNNNKMQLYNNFINQKREYMNLTSLLLIFTFSLTIRVGIASCGDGNLEASEQCDDGNTVINDGCDSTCQKQPYYKCDTSTPNVCKLDVVISLKLVGVNRISSKNKALLYLEPNYKLDVFSSINFDSIFNSSIANATLTAIYRSQLNLIQLAIDYQQTLEQTTQTFKLILSATNKFWYDSLQSSFQLKGSNCQLTWQDNLWMSAIFTKILLATVIITLIVVFVSIRYQKWIGLELAQVYQSVYYRFFLLNRFPYEFTPFFEVLRYSSGYDDVYQLDFQRFYTLPAHLGALRIQKQFIANINVDLIFITTVAIILAVLSGYKFKLKLRLQSQINSNVKKRLVKAEKYSRFMFGQVFVLLILVLMFKIINSFVVQISPDSASYQLMDEEVNSTLGIITFLIVFIVIIYIFNWYLMIPDNLADGQEFHSLKFSNMKFFYPIMYLIYQIFFILTISIYYKRQYTIYILLSAQILYFLLIIYVWPYNTPRKINRILDNFTVLFNQFIIIFITCLMFRWKTLLQGTPRSQNSFQFSIYVFVIFAFLVCSTILTIIRLCIFNKDVQCICRKQDQDGDEPNIIYNKDNKQVTKQQTMIQRHNSINQTLNSNRQQADIGNLSLLSTPMHSKNMPHLLNEKYSNWKKSKDQQRNRLIKRERAINIRKTNGNNAELIKTPLEVYQQMKIDDQPLQLKEN